VLGLSYEAEIGGAVALELGGVYGMTKSLNAFLYQQAHATSIFIREKNGLFIIAS